MAFFTPHPNKICIFKPSFRIDSIKICKDCKNFIPENKQCELFGGVDMVTGLTTYMQAYQARNITEYCDKEAKYFQKNTLSYNRVQENGNSESTITKKDF
jgi:hypothetical protein